MLLPTLDRCQYDTGGVLLSGRTSGVGGQGGSSSESVPRVSAERDESGRLGEDAYERSVGA